MCGICGVVRLRPPGPVPEDLLRRMRDTMVHRGPDDEGCAELSLPGAYRLGLAQTRLAILDLSPQGHQPMTEPETGSWKGRK